jgi:hypothetical protein
MPAARETQVPPIPLNIGHLPQRAQRYLGTLEHMRTLWERLVTGVVSSDNIFRGAYFFCHSAHFPLFLWGHGSSIPIFLWVGVRV